VKLGERGAREGGEQGEGELPARKRKPRKKELVAARVKNFLACNRCESTPGVQQLNAGFFALERMRAAQAVRAKGRATKVRGR
jgi:hypothetical protein